MYESTSGGKSHGPTEQAISTDLKPLVPVAPSDEGELLNAFLADRDVPCPRCGYNLRMLVGRRCPECGDELTLRVGLVEPRMGAYLTALSASCAGVGGGGLFSLIGLTAAPLNWWVKPAAICLLSLLTVSSVMLTTVLARRRRFRAAPIGVQWAMAIASCVLVAVLSTLVVALFDD